MKATDYIQKLFVIFRHARIELLFWGMVMMPVMADDGSYGNEFAIGGGLLFLIVIAVLYRMMKKQQKENILEINQMNAEIMAGRLRVMIANLADLVDGISFRLQHDRRIVLQQFDALSPVKDIVWQKGLFELAESSALGKRDQNIIREAIGKVQQLLQLEQQIIQCYDTVSARFAENIIALAGDAASLLQKVSSNLMTY